LGIPVRTRHNEVAPGQFECAPTFEEVNLAIDHNALLMDLMQKVAEKHNFRVLFHEKPFAGINGSGKHNNWSLSTDTGINLLAPTSKPKENLRFLTFLLNVVKAVHDHADLLRASVSSAGNEHRLGANEAPPSIVSVFLGGELTNMLEELVNKGEITLEKGENFYYKLGITRIPNLQRDNTDRNRTSPFCFTGNKFEYRAVGSAQNSASAMIVLNTIVANQLAEFKKEMDERLAAGEEKKVAVVSILKRYFKESKRILFEGNGYSEEWVKIAQERGLSNIRETYDALHAYVSDGTIHAFEKMGVLSARELHARYEIELENYVKKLQIESRVIGDLALNHVVSTVVKYQFKLAQTARALTDLGMLEEAEPIKEIIHDISTHVVVIKKLVHEMTEARKVANNLEDLLQRATHYGSSVKGYFDEIRYHVDKLELLIDDEDWPLAKYREMLFME
jgi:glutamine synthetase